MNEPTDLAIGLEGEIFVLVGHGQGPPHVLKFDPEGELLKSWGEQGTGPSQFDTPHSVVVDTEGMVYVADRQNRRIQIFDSEGNYVKEWAYKGLPCGLYIHSDGTMYMVSGFAGEILQLDENGRAVGAQRPARTRSRRVRRGALHDADAERRHLGRRHGAAGAAQVREAVGPTADRSRGRRPSRRRPPPSLPLASGAREHPSVRRRRRRRGRHRLRAVQSRTSRQGAPLPVTAYRPFTLDVTDFGPIARACVELRPLTVFVGAQQHGEVLVGDARLRFAPLFWE